MTRDSQRDARQLAGTRTPWILICQHNPTSTSLDSDLTSFACFGPGAAASAERALSFDLSPGTPACVYIEVCVRENLRWAHVMCVRFFVLYKMHKFVQPNIFTCMHTSSARMCLPLACSKFFLSALSDRDRECSNRWKHRPSIFYSWTGRGKQFKVSSTWNTRNSLGAQVSPVRCLVSIYLLTVTPAVYCRTFSPYPFACSFFPAAQ